jgi:PKD repeat protein
MKAIFIIILALSLSIISKAADYYWVGGSGNWTDFSNHWATTSGGSTFQSLSPTPLDNVYFDANSFTATGQTVTVNATNVFCKSMSWSGVTNNPGLSTSSTSNTLQIFGSLTLSPQMKFNFNGSLQFKSTAKGNTVTTAGKTFPRDIYFNGIGGEWTLQDDLRVASSYIFYLQAGTFKTNKKSITAGQVNISATESPTDPARTFDFSYSTIAILSGQFRSAFAYNLTIISTKSTILLYATGGAFIAKSDQTFSTKIICMDTTTLTSVYAEGCYIDTVIFRGPGSFYNGPPRVGYARFEKSATLYDNGTFGTLVFLGSPVAFDLGTTQTITKMLIASGNPGNPLQISSRSGGSKATLKMTSGNVCGEYLYLQDINATGGAKFYAGKGSVDLSNNTGWIFQGTTPCTTVDTKKYIAGVYVSTTPACAGDKKTVYFSASGKYGVANTFIAQLSDNTGSFASPTEIGSASNSPITATIPPNTIAGAEYRIRVVSTDSVIIGYDNGSNLTINKSVKPTVKVTYTEINLCNEASIKLTPNYTNQGISPSFVWKINHKIIGTGTSINTTVRNKDTITIEMTSNATCASPAIVSDDSIFSSFKPKIIVSQNTLTASNVNEWYFNDVKIVGATSSKYIATASGEYKALYNYGSCTTQFSDSVNITITSPTQAPVANFSASSTNIQIGGSVNYTDNSTNIPTSWEWTFTGGNPNTSNSQNPSNIVYSAEGCYDVKLIAANSFGRDTILQTCYINVSGTSTSCNELFFSEYLEGASNNKAIEIYNPSGTAVNLSSYSIQLYANGSTTPTNTIVLSGSIASRDVYVLANSGAIASILSSSDITSAVCGFNGDDALVLKKGSNVIDVIGVVGTDPGTFWSVGTGSTLDYTLVRNSTVDAPSTSWATVQNQWTVYPVNTTTYLGQHTSTCSTITAIVDDPLQNNIHIYPNPTEGVTTISLSTDVADIEITDLLGNQLIKKQTVQKATNIALDDNGVYIVRITTKNGTSTRKLIVRH